MQRSKNHFVKFFFNRYNTLSLLIIPVMLLMAMPATAQQYDILLNNGHVIDPKNDINEEYDVAIKGNKIAEVSKNIDEDEAAKVVDASGLYVTPGLIDLHAHIFHGTNEGDGLSNGFSSLPPDGFTLPNGVTTVVDAGCPGWKNFATFKEQTIDHSTTRVYAFLNIVGSGMKGGVIEQNLDDMDPKLTAMTVKNHEELIGIKLAHYNGHDWTPTRRAVEAGERANVPVMIDFGGAEPPLSIEQLFMEELRPGDIFTHCYANVGSREAIVDEDGNLKPFVKDAEERGIIFDVGHGGGSFLWAQAVPAMNQGLPPNTISTDLHTGSMNDGMKNQLNVMSKFLTMDMALEDVIEASTWKPAKVIQREEKLGHLTEGSLADVTVLNVREGDFGFIDVDGKRLDGNRRLDCELTFVDGEIVYDLNGIAKTAFQE